MSLAERPRPAGRPFPARLRQLRRAAAFWTERRIRLVTGLVLFAFIALHFANHALGLVSLTAMEEGEKWFGRIWGGGPMRALFYVALMVHFALALHALYKRRTLRMPMREAMQILFGLGLPLLIIPHVLAVGLAEQTTGHDADYAHVVHALWAAPANALQQVAALVVAWVHGCLGLWFWLRFRPWFPRIALPAFTIALLVPVLSILGFVAAGKEIGSGLVTVVRHPATPAGAALAAQASLAVHALYFGAIAATLLARALKQRRGLLSGFRVTYPEGQVIAVPIGTSVLEASRIGGIPHVAVCGGKGRCSTCRVRVIEGQGALPPPHAAERTTLERIDAPSDIRLACQLRPTANLRVAPVVTAELPRLDGGATLAWRAGAERSIVVLFCDLRGFTAMTERRLPFDTVFLLNRFFAAVGEAVESSDGYLDKFIGDGALALFGLGKPQDAACADALIAAARIARAADALNRTLAQELGGARIRVAIGLHTGAAIVGHMGYGRAASLTVVGDTINTASRLETVAKEHDAELVVSVELAERGGLPLKAGKRKIVAIRGRSAPLDVLVVTDARRLDEKMAVAG
ncbi:adenylate/guanylate cyclase domain-containing protein [Aureimonas glaciei]|uniref:Adenylate/guanylate cyclase domain-containing protein n=1 Tax=Aureimonas glaciei TaxID=1776957 RepID=A0A916V2J2_9HYPH|nr:adenylate/guanylate cyclase domain-containing protein [Aureimonas glaciei]GGD02170.1 adenylate/guanylate cyclase domain-containing protein [Aureimonas glaciei]